MTVPLVFAAVEALVARSFMPRRKALSELERETERGVREGGQVRGHVAREAELGIPAVVRKSSWPPCPPISTFEPAMFAPPERSKQMNGILP